MGNGLVPYWSMQIRKVIRFQRDHEREKENSSLDKSGILSVIVNRVILSPNKRKVDAVRTKAAEHRWDERETSSRSREVPFVLNKRKRLHTNEINASENVERRQRHNKMGSVKYISKG